MRCILIDPFKRQLTEQYLANTPGKLNAYYEILNVSIVEAVRITKNDVIYIDEEGLFKNDQYFFQWNGYDQPLAGRGLIVGTTNYGEDISTKLSLDFVAEKVLWPIQGPTSGVWVSHADLTRLSNKAVAEYITKHPEALK